MAFGLPWALYQDVKILKRIRSLGFLIRILSGVLVIRYLKWCLHLELTIYVSYRPDPEAIAVNAFHISWTQYSFYAFPPFSVIMQVLRKIQEDQSTGILVIPNWPTQVWWTRAMDMLVQQPVLLPRDKHTLFLPSHPEQIHHLHNKLCLLLCHLSGNSSKSRAFRQQLQELSRAHGSQVQENSTHPILRNLL